MLLRRRRAEPMEPLSGLLTELEVIGANHEELYDTDVREQMSMAVVEIFLRGNGQYELPDSYGMFSVAANRKVHDALSKFAAEVAKSTIDVQANLELLGPHGAKSPSGQWSECFFGAVSESYKDSSGSAPRYLWWNSPVAYFGCMIVPGALLLWLVSIFMSQLEAHPLWRTVVMIVGGTVALATAVVFGDTLWRFIHERTVHTQSETQSETDSR